MLKPPLIRIALQHSIISSGQGQLWTCARTPCRPADRPCCKERARTGGDGAHRSLRLMRVLSVAPCSVVAAVPPVGPRGRGRRAHARVRERISWHSVFHKLKCQDFERFTGRRLPCFVAATRYDAACCHVQGVCEWVACQDSVFSTLEGGRTPVGAAAEVPPAGGLMLGSAAHAVLPSRLYNASAGPLLLFQTRHIAAATLTVGAPSDVSLTLRMTSPVANSTLALFGGFWDVAPQTARAVFWQTIFDVDGARVGSRRALFGGRAVSGGQRYVFSRRDEARDLAPGFEVVFEKELELRAAAAAAPRRRNRQ